MLAEKGIPHEPVVIDLADRPAWLYELNPTGRVPVVEEDAWALPESVVINEFLEERYPEPPLLPADPGARAAARLRIFRDNDFTGPYYDLRRGEVGAEDAFFAIPPPPDGDRLEILYVGGFLPLHGVRTIIEAVALLERERDTLPPFGVTLLGKGIEFDAARAIAAECSVQTLVLAGPTPYAELPVRMAAAHIVLGAFGTTAKAGRVVPHKVYQGLAAGRAVVTGDGPGVREVLTPDRDVVLVPRGDAPALAAALAAVLRDAARREAVARGGRARALEIGTPARLGVELRAILEGGGTRMP